MAEMKGIDVSHWQAGLDLAKTDAQFVIIKATESTNYVDPKCDSFYQKAKSLGLPRGVYHFYRGGGSKEADWFLKNTKGYHGDGILALDFEDHTSDVKGALAWLDRVYSSTGVKPVIYMSASVKDANNWSSVVDADYGLWLARWSSSPGSPSPWKTLALWQYTDAHPTGGMAVDGDVFYGDAAAWKKYAGKSSGGSSGGGSSSSGGSSGGSSSGGSSKPKTKSYTVKSGDTLSEIAVKYDTTTAELMKLNPSIKDPDVIYAGQTIQVPA